MRRTVILIAILAGMQFGCDRADDNPLTQEKTTGPTTAATQPATTLAPTLTEVTALDSPRTLDAMAFSPDGRTLVLAGGTGSSLGSRGFLAVYDLQKGKFLHKIQGRHAYRRVAFTSDGNQIVAASSYQVHVWDVKEWKRTVLARHWSVLTEIALSPNGKMLALAGRMARFLTPPGIVVYDLATGKEIRSFRGDFINSIAFSRDSSILAACNDTEITLWNTKTWDMLSKIAPPITPPKAARPVTIHEMLLPGNGDLLLLDLFARMHLWDRKQNASRWSVTCLSAAVSGDGHRMATVEWDQRTRTRHLVLKQAISE